MRIKGKVLKRKIDEKGRMLIVAQCNGKLPPKDSLIDIRFGAQRSNSQNALLWTYYTFLINDAGLKEHGFFCPEALHSSLKAYFLSEKIMSKGQWKIIEEGSTSKMNKIEFGEYLEKIDHFVCDFFKVDTSSFWNDYRENYAPF